MGASQSSSSSSAGVSARVDFLNLCKENSRTIQGQVSRVEQLLNKRQCQDLSTKLSKTTKNIVLLCEGSTSDLFRPALESLYLCLEKAKVLVNRCRRGCKEEDWCAESVFQIQNESSFREILMEVGLCYNAVYEQAKSCGSDSWKGHPDLRKSSMFDPAKRSKIRADQQEIRKRLEGLVPDNPGFFELLPQYDGRNKVERCRARYLLRKLDCSLEQSQKDNLNPAIFWTKEDCHDPKLTWGSVDLLGSPDQAYSSGVIGVIKTTWLDIPCAKKVFHHDEEIERVFEKEAGILARSKHPRIVNFICCGNGQEKGDRFIAMELMEKSLADQIEVQKKKDKHFSPPVVVDMMVQMARGMLYLHDRGVAHRDLKPENVVVSTIPQNRLENYFCLKLVDFGVSKTEVVDLKSITPSARGIGTIKYGAPEVHPKANPGSKQRAIWFKADVYSFAITCSHVLSLKQPFENIEPTDFHTEQLKGTRPVLPDDCPQELVSLLEDCWSVYPRSRPSFMDICIRLEKFRHKILRGESLALNIDQPSAGFDFVQAKVEEESNINQKGFDHVDFDFEDDEVVSRFTCTSNHALTFRQQSPYSDRFNFKCDICGNPFHESNMGSVSNYHCQTCGFDAHPVCAEIKGKAKVFFHDYPLLLQIRNYDSDNLDAICSFCQETLQDSEWVYESEEAAIDFRVHALCTKYSEEMFHLKHEHLLKLEKSPTDKFCTFCSHKLKGYHYTCSWCNSLDLHPFCAIRPTKPPCPINTSHHHLLSLDTDERSFRCGKCGTSGSSWFYRCNQCQYVDIQCVDCMDGMEEEEDDRDKAYEKFISDYSSFEDNHTKVDLVSKLVDKLSVSNALEASSSSSSRPHTVNRNLESTKIKPLVKAKSKAKEQPKLDYLRKLEEILQNLPSSNLSQADLDLLAATHHKLHELLLQCAKMMSLS